MNVLIDPGHAPGNANAGKNGYREYAGMWKLSNFLKDTLTASGICAVLTRTEQQDPSLDVRGGMAKGYENARRSNWPGSLSPRAPSRAFAAI